MKLNKSELLETLKKLNNGATIYQGKKIAKVPVKKIYQIRQIYKKTGEIPAQTYQYFFIFLIIILTIMQKRGQINQIFIWIFILILAVSILTFGIKTVKQTQELSKKVEIDLEVDNLKESIKNIFYLDIGSSINYKLNFPESIDKICFVFSPEPPTPIIPNADIHPFLVSLPQYNFYVFGEEARFLKLEHIINEDGEDDFNCFDNSDKLLLKNEGGYVRAI